MPAITTPVNITLVFGALFLLALGEGVVLSRRGGYDWRDFWVSSFDLAARLLILLSIPGSVLTPFADYLESHQLLQIPADRWWSLLLLSLGVDLGYYALHRASHASRWFWAYHAPHHTSQQMSWAAGFRLGLLDKLLGCAFFFTFLVLIGFSIHDVICMLTLNSIFQLLVHVDWLPKLGWLEYVFVTPSNHRVHHSRHPKFHDKNFGGLLIIWDRIFGTYAPEDERCAHRPANARADYNLLRVELRAFFHLVHGIFKARNPRQLIKHVMGRPY